VARQKSGGALASGEKHFFVLTFFGPFLCQDKKGQEKLAVMKEEIKMLLTFNRQTSSNAIKM
jgi:hypothetical protein